MTKKELARAAAMIAGVTQAKAEEIEEAIFDGITDSLRRGEKVEIRGFGTFKVKNSPARMGRNPKTGAEVQIPARKKVVFKASKEMGV